MLYNVMLVDDDEIIRETYKTVLEIEGFTVHTASSPFKAIQIIRTRAHLHKNEYLITR